MLHHCVGFDVDAEPWIRGNAYYGYGKKLKI